MIYARVIDGVIHDMAPISDLYPTTTFPASGPSQEFLASENLQEIQLRKAYNPSTEKLAQVQPYLEGGVVYGVSVLALTQEELTAIDNAIKLQNENTAKQLLAATDWTQLPDVALANRQEFQAYRDQLRQIARNPQTTVVWPVLPANQWQ
jgi:hypothetical protein